MSRFRPVVLVVALAGAFAVGSVIGSRFQPAPATVATPPPVQRVAALGRLQPEGGILPIYGPAGDRVVKLLVADGQEVAANTELLVLESLALRQLELDVAKLQQTEGQARFEAARKAGEDQIAEAEARLQALTETAPFELKTIAAKVAVASRQAEAARRQLARLKSLNEQRPLSIAQQDMDQQEMLAHQAVEELKAAEAQQAKAKVVRKENEAVARAQFAAAQSELKKALAEASPQMLARNVELAQLRLDRTRILAPSAGRVLRVATRVGETVTTMPLVTLGQTARMTVVAEAYETDLQYLLAWQQAGTPIRATVTSKALPAGAKPTGTVTRIGRLIGKNQVFSIDPTADVDRRVAEVTILLDEPSPADQFINLQVDVELRPERASSGES